MDRIGFFRNGWLLDEVVLSDASFVLRRAGKARYEVRLANGLVELGLLLWTTQRGAVEPNLYDGPPPSWVRVISASDELESVESEGVGVHFEHLDRNYYYLGFQSADEHWMFSFAGAGYLKLAPTAHRAPQLVEIHLGAAFPPVQLRDALAFALRIAPTRLVFVPVVELPGPTLRPGQILVTVTRRPGDFPLTLGFCVLEQELPAAVRLTRALRCRALISDRTSNPYTWTLITDDGSILAADVDVESLAEGAFVLAVEPRAT